MNSLNSIINFSKILHSKLEDIVNPGGSNSLTSSLSSLDSDVESDDERAKQLQVTLKKSLVKEQLNMVKIIKNSSQMIYLLNSAMLTHTLIKQGKHTAQEEVVKDPLSVLREFS
mmetsp:Transcript_35087/g.53833  ORF Transcript_35087/g.53833 Transcript_35087/m.53833 type:complete len:114 (-) Transcript_35087:2267-2608(-)